MNIYIYIYIILLILYNNIPVKFPIYDLVGVNFIQNVKY